MSPFWDTNISIGSLLVPRLMAAPLDGITDAPMRQLIRRFSPQELLFSEMRHVALVANQASGESLKYASIEHPIAYQFSANTRSMHFIKPAVEKVIAAGFDLINLNIGCPARNVTKSGSGSALMATPNDLAAIIDEFMHCINDRVPFTVKIRAGFKEKNAVAIAQLSERLGAQCIIVHPRTAPQLFTGLPDTQLVAEVKTAVRVPVIFSGNINSFARAEKMRQLCDIDGVMIGRALWGCPWKMQEIQMQYEGKSFHISAAQSLRYAIEHLKLVITHYGPQRFYPFKKQLPIYLKFLPGAAQMRQKLLTITTAEELLTTLTELHTETVQAEQAPQAQERDATL